MICRTLIALAFGIVATVGLAWFSAIRDLPESSASLFARELREPEVKGPAPDGPPGRILIPSIATIRATRLLTFVHASGPMSLIRCGNSQLNHPDHSESAPPAPPVIPPWEPRVPRWARDAIRPSMCAPLDSGSMPCVSVDARGWPCRALCSSVTRMAGSSGPTTKIDGGISVESHNNAGLVANRGYGVLLPYRPIWSGLVINTLTFGVPAWLLLSAIPLTRRHLRRRRNHCLKCNYNLQGLAPNMPCPECGR